jgi:acetyl/propionyl-CoA carboxylase alpha subunit
MTRTWVFSPGDKAISLKGRLPHFEITCDGRVENMEAVLLADGRLSLLLPDGRQVCGRVVRRDGGELLISTGRGRRRLSVTDPLRARLAVVLEQGAADHSESEEVRALMPGRILEVAVAAGDVVAAGGLLLVLEAMKMQNELRATRAGIVTRCAATPGQTVEAGALLLTLQPQSEQDAAAPSR